MEYIASLLRFIQLICWASVVSGNYSPLVVANTTATSTSSYDSSTITSAASTITSMPTQPGPFAETTYTGVSNFLSIDDWCTSLYVSWREKYESVFYSTSLTTLSDLISYSWPSSGTAVPVTTRDDTVTFISTSYSSLSQYASEIYTPPQECFATCNIEVGEVQLMYWPTPVVNGTTVTPTLTSQSAVINGATFYSPSNYLIFTEINAFDCAIGGSPCTRIGKNYTDITMTYGQNELSSKRCEHEAVSMDYADFNTPLAWSVISKNLVGPCAQQTAEFSSIFATQTRLSPTILFPTGLSTAINPDWKRCTFNLYEGLLDPPTVLTPVQQLTAAPGSSPTNSNAAPTTTPTAVAETSPAPVPDTPSKTTSTQAPPTTTPDPPAETPTTADAIASAVAPSPADPENTSAAAPVNPQNSDSSSPADPGNISSTSPANPETSTSPSPADPGLTTSAVAADSEKSSTVSPADPGNANSASPADPENSGSSSPADADLPAAQPSSTGNGTPASAQTQVSGQSQASQSPGSQGNGGQQNGGQSPSDISSAPQSTAAGQSPGVQSPGGQSQPSAGQSQGVNTNIGGIIASIGGIASPTSNPGSTTYSGLNSSTSTNSPLQAASASTVGFQKAYSYSLAFITLYFWITL